MPELPDGTVRPEHPPRTPLRVLVDRLTDRPEVAAALEGDAETSVTGISLSSQRIRPGDLYAALPGSRAHGIAYLDDAVAAGAVAVLTDPEGAAALGGRRPVVVVDRPRDVLGLVSAEVYGHPTERLRTIGVTGTQGKTTTTRLLESGLQRAGVPSAVIGTIGTRVLGHDVKTALTTPEAPDLHGLFALMVERGVEACAMEVSSHALVMGRVDGVVFDVAVFTNLGRDHLDFHADVEDYYRAKASLFTPARARRALVNSADDFGRRLVEETVLPVRTYAVGADADWQAVDVVLDPSGSTFTVVAPDGARIEAACPLPGAFNVENALAAVAAAGEAGLDAAAVAAGIAAGGGVPGRLEPIDEGQPFLAVVDYAHKPDAVEAAILALRPLTRGRVIVVLGAGGDRDPGKRPLMGEIAARLADLLVVTDDNPRSEDPAAIRAARVEGARAARAEMARADKGSVVEVGDRRAAIRHALAEARPGDVVLVAGKGHETGQEVAGVVHTFDDRDVVRTELARLASGGPT